MKNKMDSLDLSDAGLIYLPDLSTHSIKNLNASWNHIQLLWDHNMPIGLEELNLEGNNISSDGLISLWPDSLRLINLSKNPFSSIDHVIHWPTSLRVLNLSKTNLRFFESQFFPDSLEELDISFTEITCLKFFPVALKNFPAYATRISSLPIQCPDTLESFIVSGTRGRLKMTSLPKTWGKSLKSINLSFNGLKQIPNNLPTSLEYANFSDNFIEEIPPRKKFPQELSLLVLGRNRIRQLPHWFSELPNMKFTINNNLLIEYPTCANCLYSYDQYIGRYFTDAAKQIQGAWRRRRAHSPLRTWKRMKILKYDLLALAMCPERAGKFENISPEWNYKYTFA